MSNKDIAEMIEISFAILIALGTFIWLYLYYKLGKIYDELKEIRKESKVKRCFDIPKDVAERLLEDTERKEEK